MCLEIISVDNNIMTNIQADIGKESVPSGSLFNSSQCGKDLCLNTASNNSLPTTGLPINRAVEQ